MILQVPDAVILKPLISGVLVAHGLIPLVAPVLVSFPFFQTRFPMVSRTLLDILITFQELVTGSKVVDVLGLSVEVVGFSHCSVLV